MNRSQAQTYLGFSDNPDVDVLMVMLGDHIRMAVAVNDTESYRKSIEAVTEILVDKRLMTSKQAEVCLEEVDRSTTADGVTLDRLGNTETNMVTIIYALISPELDRYHHLLDHYADAGRIL